jgi:hypothetical protein
MTNLKQARQSGSFEQFIKEREGEEVDQDIFTTLLKRIEKGQKPSPSENPSEDR